MNGISILIPPLRERLDELEALCIDATNAATCVDLQNTVLSCHVQRG